GARLSFPARRSSDLRRAGRCRAGRGASRGLGLERVGLLLRRGDNVAATTRSVERLTAALDGVDTGRLLPLEVALTDEEQVRAAVAATKERFGGLDVVVNNAGYGFLAAVEEVTDAEARDVRRADLRRVERAAGGAARVQGEPRWAHRQRLLDPRIDLLPRLGLYCAGKYALEGLTDSLAAEVADFGIAVNLIEPGYMRTDFLGPQSLGLPSATVDAYPAIREMTDAHLGMPGTQLGDPARAAAALIAV